MITNFQKHVIAILQESPNGLTSNEIATLQGEIKLTFKQADSLGIIGKARSSHGRNVYRARMKQGAVERHILGGIAVVFWDDQSVLDDAKLGRVLAREIIVIALGAKSRTAYFLK